MSNFPTKPEEYRAYLLEQMNAAELLISTISPNADRMDIMNQLLLTINNQLSAILFALSNIQPGTLGSPSYTGEVNAIQIATGTLTVVTPGIPKRFPQRAIPDGKAVSIKAPTTNIGFVYIGNTSADASDHTIAYLLDAGDVVEYYIKDLSRLWLDSILAGEGIVWTVERNE